MYLHILTEGEESFRHAFISKKEFFCKICSKPAAYSWARLDGHIREMHGMLKVKIVGKNLDQFWDPQNGLTPYKVILTEENPAAT